LKKGLKTIFSRRKKKAQNKQTEPAPAADKPVEQPATAPAAGAAAAAAVPATETKPAEPAPATDPKPGTFFLYMLLHLVESPNVTRINTMQSKQP
jgi:biotin carboxyl carrier protein